MKRKDLIKELERTGCALIRDHHSHAPRQGTQSMGTMRKGTTTKVPLS